MFLERLEASMVASRTPRRVLPGLPQARIHPRRIGTTDGPTSPGGGGTLPVSRFPDLPRASDVTDPQSGTHTAWTVSPADRWEHGSFFPISLEVGSADLLWAAGAHTLWGSGRHALRALLAWGSRAHGWRRLLVPSYFCQDVVPALKSEVDVGVYEHAPTEPDPNPVEAGAGDVVLVVATFGMHPPITISGGPVVVEDHSHDPLSPWAASSTAHYVVASLRKTMPLPDGGVLWSPLGLTGPPQAPVTADHARLVLQRLEAMNLKLRYLSGDAVSKEEFRSLAGHSERRIGRGDISGISTFSRARLSTMPAGRWREARAANRFTFRQALGELPGMSLVDAPFAATLVFDEPDARDRMREALIAARIYPAVLWPLSEPEVDGIPARHVDLARRILSIHCDYRYGTADMVRVAGEIRKAASAR